MLRCHLHFRSWRILTWHMTIWIIEFLDFVHLVVFKTRRDVSGIVSPSHLMLSIGTPSLRQNSVVAPRQIKLEYGKGRHCNTDSSIALSSVRMAPHNDRIPNCAPTFTRLLHVIRPLSSSKYTEFTPIHSVAFNLLYKYTPFPVTQRFLISF